MMSFNLTLMSPQSFLLFTMIILMVKITDGSSGVDGQVVEKFNNARKTDGDNSLLDKSHMGIGKCRIIKGTRVNDDGKGYFILKCNGLTNFTITLQQIPSQVVPTVRSIEITNSTIPVLNFGIFNQFPTLENISITHSSVSLIHELIPVGIISLNLSSNHIKHIESSLFSHPKNKHSHHQHHQQQPRKFSSQKMVGSSEINETMIGSGSGESYTTNGGRGENDIRKPIHTTTGESTEGTNYSQSLSATLSRLQIIDLSHNRISELPKSIFYLKSLKSLRLSGNQFRCEFVWEKLWEWYEMQSDPNILEDADEAFCGVVDDVRFFHYSVLGVLKARKELEETCATVDKMLCPDCSLYAFQREGGNGQKSSHGSISISLKIGCANRNLTQLPPIPPQTWQLNISNNFIKNLNLLKEPMYSNLIILDGDNNEINLESLTGTPFFEKYNYLSLQNNSFTQIPTHILSSFKTMRGQGVTFFGGNFINCDCDVAKEIKPLLIENSNRIRDMRDIYCNEANGDGYVRVMDLQYADVCYIETIESSNELYLYLIIVVEIVLILIIIGKVWHDQRNFRRTGMLPWLSSCMPRLPCDAMLESVKEPPNFNNRHSMSVNSSSTNVQGHSHSAVAHIQLKDVRSASTAHSDKSSSQHSQFSSFPVTSSRTSPV